MNLEQTAYHLCMRVSRCNQCIPFLVNSCLGPAKLLYLRKSVDVCEYIEVCK